MKLPIHNEVVAAFTARDPDRIAGLYAEDAVFFTPGRPAIAGRAAIAKVMAEDFRDPGFSLELADQHSAISASGDLAYTRGAFKVGFTSPGSHEVQSVGGNYLQVFRKKADGGWEIVEDISSPGVPAAGPPGA